jgi:MOSC domain-containing protein YiiM
MSGVLTLLGVQAAPARRVQINGRNVMTAIHKAAVIGQAAVLPLGLMADEQADPSVHGGLDKAVYAYPTEHYAFWREARQQAGVGGLAGELPWGSVGENLSLQGLLEHQVWAGDLLVFAHCTLRVTQPREPCYKFNAAMGFGGAARAMALAGCCGFYLKVDQPGHLSAGEPFTLQPGPRRLSIPEMFRAKMSKHLR